MTLRNTSGAAFSAVIHGLEYAHPYTLSVVVVAKAYARMDIKKDDLAAEMRGWLGGSKPLEFPCLMLPRRIDDAMMKFIKFGTPPPQTDIFLWILSRTEIYMDGSSIQLYFGGRSVDDDAPPPYSSIALENELEHTVEKSVSSTLPQKFATDRPKSAPRLRQSTHQQQYQRDPFTITREMLGSSQALSQLQKEKLKGRECATLSYVRVDWTDDHYRLTNHIEKTRHDIENDMETRRRTLQVLTTRQQQAIHRYRKIREKTVNSRSTYNWVHNASNEVVTLNNIAEAVKEDIRHQKCRTQRATNHIRWTMAPNGYVNRRGTYTKGIVLGPGPLPADATTSLEDPQMLRAVNHYYWDQHGRKHRKDPNAIDQGSLVDLAMSTIRKAAKNASLYKLNLKAIFDEMDVSGDGFITIQEMDSAFQRLGVKLDQASLDAIYRHFDPNNSGTIHYGEFVWAFFNRRSFLRQWKRCVSGMTYEQMRTKFRRADINGNGYLTKKEFKKLLIGMGIQLSDNEIDILVSRFDKDGDGELNLQEFMQYIKEESGEDIPMISTRTTAAATTTSLGGTDLSNTERADYNRTGPIVEESGPQQRRTIKNTVFKFHTLDD